MTTARFCPQCGSALLPNRPNQICPRCAFRVALEPAETVERDPFTDRHEPFVPPKPDQLAQHFPQLEILDLIGQGGMGAVYKARQKGLDRLVALKILPPDSARDPAFAERFSREARALAKLSHPNIVSVYDSGQAGGLFYFIMEYVDGVNLRQAIQSGQLVPKQALSIVPQVCDALQYAHDEGIVHRDIKPENVLVDTKGRVKIADFGIARLLGQSPDHLPLTGEHQVLGTPRYMAPEQLEGTHDVDHRADIYSLGVVFYEMLTGELPLGRFAPPSRKVQVDVRLDEVVLRALEKEPDLRYQQAGEVKTAVQTITSASDLRLHRPRLYGHEYRSKTTIFGIPLVHVAKGVDPITHRRRVAKGIIAIGDLAIGGLAIGGVSCGVVSIGGVAFGGVTLGGVSIAAALACGGLALSCGLALGGLAVAPVAIGGCAVGYYVSGGAGFGVYPFAANARSPEGEEFFKHSLRGLWQLLPILATASLIIPFLFLCWTAIKGAASLFRSQAGAPMESSTSAHHDAPNRSGNGLALGCFLVLMFAFLTMVPVALIVSYLTLSQRRVVTAEQAAAAARAGDAAAREAAAVLEQRLQRTSSRQTSLNWTADGPAVSETLRDRLKLDKLIEEQINQILREIHQQYVAIEASHLTRETVAAHQTIMIRIPRAEIEQLQQQLWNRLDPLLNADQQATIRRTLPVTPKTREELIPGETVDEVLLPGILGWGEHSAQIDLFQGGEWYEWEISSQGVRKDQTGRGLDPRWKRLWKAPKG